MSYKALENYIQQELKAGGAAGMSLARGESKCLRGTKFAIYCSYLKKV